MAASAVTLFRQGLTVAAIAHHLGVKPAAVNDMLEGMGEIRRCPHCTIILEPHEHELCDVCDAIAHGGTIEREANATGA